MTTGVQKTALVTGTSGGLGMEFADLLASRGYDLVLTARNAEKLDDAAARLRADYGVDVLTVPVDLGGPDGVDLLMQTVQTRGIGIDLLVNNAGQGLQGLFLSRPSAETDAMLRLNIISLTRLTHAVAEQMAGRGGGHILMVASMTAFMPAPGYAAYAASKSYVRNFGEALHAELAPKNIGVTVLLPGLMDTGFLNAAGHTPGARSKPATISPRMAAETGIRALFDRRQSVVAGQSNKVVAFISRFIPRKTQTRLMANALDF